MTVDKLIEELQKIKLLADEAGKAEVFFDGDKMNVKLDHRPIKEVCFAWFDGELRVML